MESDPVGSGNVLAKPQLDFELIFVERDITLGTILNGQVPRVYYDLISGWSK